MPIRGPKGGLLRFLTKDQTYDMHLAILEVLERVGVKVETQRMLRIFADGGANVDFAKKLVKFPQHLVEEALKKAPRIVVLSGRKAKYDIILEDDRVYFGLGGSPKSRILDVETGELRKPTKRDVEDTTRLGDALPTISFMQNLAQASDITPEVQYEHVAEAMFNNTEKHLLISAPGSEIAIRVLKMASAVEEVFGRKPVSIYSEPSSPLMISASQENIIEASKSNIPIVLCSAPMAGATAPVTLAGAVVQNIAENLSALVLSQLVTPGAPVVLGSTPTIMDPKTGMFSLASPELMLEQAMSAQICRYYSLPFFGVGCCSDSKTFDAQAAAEAAMTALMSALSGLNMIQDVGVINLDNAGCLELAIVADEIIGITQRILKGSIIDDESLAIDVIASVGPSGHFLSQKHTLKFLEREIYIPKLFDRRSEEGWAKAGAKELHALARKKARKILKEHFPDPLPKDTQQKLKEIVREAENKVVGKINIGKPSTQKN